MLNKFLYYCIVLPISRLPITVLYGLSKIIFVSIFYIFPYRKKLVNYNLKRSFPNYSKDRIKKIRKNFYLHLSDIIVESIKNLSISKKRLEEKIKIKNPELIHYFFEQEKSVLLVSGHYNNWEYLITAQNFLIPHQAIGIGKPLSNKFWDKKINQQRSRFGMKIIHSKNFYEKMNLWKNELTATLILTDQSPGDSYKSFWYKFLNRDTAILFGTELLANQYNYPVIFFQINKIKRGFYELEFKTITENPKSEDYGFITKKHTKLLEEIIQKKPEYWLWTHKRWKRQIPKQLNKLKNLQQEKFEQKYR